MSRKSIAQIFSPNGAYVPTKCAVYLHPAGTANTAFAVDSSTVIDAANFKNRTQRNTSIVLAETNGYTGGGSLVSVGTGSVSAPTSPSVTYPVQPTDDGKHYLYFRANNSGLVAVYIDGYFVQNVTFSFSGWDWTSATSIVLPDTNIHSLELRFLNVGTEIDKIVLARTPQTLSGLGPDYVQSPYVTVHGRLANVSGGVPAAFYNSAWAINTIDQITKDGWYNFDVTNLYGAFTPSNSYGFVLSVAGASDLHYIIWDTADKLTNPSANYDNAWVADTSVSMSIRVYADYDALDEYNCVINTPEATLENNTVNDFSDQSVHPVNNNTIIVDDNIGGNDVTLDIGEKLLTLVLDQSGSMSWNDSTGLRHLFAAGVIDALDARYPSPVRFNLLKLNGEPAFSFMIPLSTQIDSNNVSDIIRESFRGKPENFAGFRVLRNSDHYPTTPIDGEIVADGYALAALDIDLEQNKQYYYTVYTYDQFDRFSYGVKIPAKTNVIDVPRGIPTFSTDIQLGYDIPRDQYTIGIWNTDEGTGDFLYDFSDGGNTLSLTKTRWLSEYDCPTGRFGLRFNGVTSQAESAVISNSSPLAFVSNGAISFWIAPFDNAYHRAIASYNNGTRNWWSVGINGNKLTFRMSTQEWTAVQGIPLEEWTHVLINHDVSGTTFYINGVESAVTFNTISLPSGGGTNWKVNIGGNPINEYDRPFFGKLSHFSAHSSTRSAGYGAASVRYSALGDPPGKIPPDNGDRLVVVNFEVPDDFNYSLIRVVRNHVRMPYYEADGDVVLEVVPTAGKHSYGLPADYDLDSDYWFRIFTKNSLGNWSPIEDSVGVDVHVPDQDRPHVIVSCGPGCVTEINPGPGFGSCPSPNIEIGRGGNQKVHIRWTLPTDTDCTLVRIFYQEDKFVAYNGNTKWIVDSSSADGDGTAPVFVGPATIGEWVDRGAVNLKTGFYTIVFANRLGSHSQLVNLAISASATADDSGIPLLEAIDVAYHIDDYDRIRITWTSPVTISSSNEGWFDDRFYFYGAICNLYGEPLPIDFPDDLKITTTIGEIQQTNVEDVFNTTTGTDTPDKIPNATFNINSGGLVTGSIRLRSSPIFSILKSISVNVSAQYNYSDSFQWTFTSSGVKFKTPLEMMVVNRDSLYLSTGDFAEPACENDYESGGSDKEKSPNRYRVNGAFIRRQQPFVARVLFTYKGLPLRQASVSGRLYDAAGGPCNISVPSLTTQSRTLSFVNNSFEIKVDTLPVLDDEGNATGTTAIQSYADIPIKVPTLPQSGRLYIRVKAQAFQAVARMNMFYPSTLRISLTAAAPLGNGADVREQFARAWFIDPDFPKDDSKIQIVPDLTVIKWALTKDGSAVRKVPFYSTDNVPLINGVYSYTRNGTARFVFFGPAKTGSEGVYNLKVIATVAGLTAEKDANLEIKIPGSNGYTNYIPDPTAPRIFCEMDECINYLWADGDDYVAMRIFRNPSDPTKTLVLDTINGGTIQAKYADKFRECSIDNNGHPVLFPLPVGTVVTVSAPGYEIIWGSVSEIKDSATGLKKLNTEGAFNALDTADITLGRDSYYTVYFRKDAQIDDKGCRDTGATNCCGFDMSPRICNLPHEIGDATGVIVSTKINLAGKPIVITGGGPIGDDGVARPPCVLVPKEPLYFKLVGIFVNGQIVDQMVVDGTTVNQFVFEVKYRGLAVPAGVCLDIYLAVNIDGQDVTKIGDFDIYTSLGIPKTTYTRVVTQYPGTNNTGIFSIASFTINPIPTDHNISVGVGVSTTYNGTDFCQPKLSSSSSGGA